MTVSIPLVAILGVVVWLTWRYMGLRAWHAIVAVLFGFLLAASASAPTIRQIVTTVVRSINH